MHTVVKDGQYCMVYTKKHDAILTDCNFVGAYVTVGNADGTTKTDFYGILENVSSADEAEQSKNGFIETNIADPKYPNNPWRYYFKISVGSPVSIHLIYTKAPFVLYDANGGEDYKFSTYVEGGTIADNAEGGNIVGFGGYFKKMYDSEGKEINTSGIDTTGYYENCEYTGGVSPDEPVEKVKDGTYKSHSAVPNENWNEGSAVFCGWSVKNKDGKTVILNGEHTVTYNPTKGNGGIVTFTDSNNSVSNLELDATHGVTLTAVWKFVNRAQAQTRNGETQVFEDSALGGTVEETLITTETKDNVAYYPDTNDITYYPDAGGRAEWRVDAVGSVGDKIMFKAKPNSNDKYRFNGWYVKETQTNVTETPTDETETQTVETENQTSVTETYKLISMSTSIAVSVEEGKLKTYYARFERITFPVIFKYTTTGKTDDYDYYEKSETGKYGKYFQDVAAGKKAVKPTGDSEGVKYWFTSPTERDSEHIFNFNTLITEKTTLYAAPSFTFNYFNQFKLKEPWYVNTFGTLKFKDQYIDLKNDPDISDYNVYMLKGTLGQSAPSASDIKKNKNTIKVGKSADNENLIFNTVTSTGKTFNRAGSTFSNFYLFNMKTPVWVVFDFTYKGAKYTSTVKDRSLYNCITTYMKDNGLYTDYPPETQDKLRAAQTKLLYSIQGMYDAINDPELEINITEPTDYYSAVGVSGLTYDSATVNPYSFTSSTTIRNIEPWGLKYSFTVNDHAFSEFDDYGAVVLTDKEGEFNAESNPISVNAILGNDNSVMYSKSSQNIYSVDLDDSGENVAAEVYYVNNMTAYNFDKNTYVVFFVKDKNGNCYYSEIIKNSYNEIASNDKSIYEKISTSIVNYSNNFIAYCNLIETANNKSE